MLMCLLVPLILTLHSPLDALLLWASMRTSPCIGYHHTTTTTPHDTDTTVLNDTSSWTLLFYQSQSGASLSHQFWLLMITETVRGTLHSTRIWLFYTHSQPSPLLLRIAAVLVLSSVLRSPIYFRCWTTDYCCTLSTVNYLLCSHTSHPCCRCPAPRQLSSAHHIVLIVLTMVLCTHEQQFLLHTYYNNNNNACINTHFFVL